MNQPHHTVPACTNTSANIPKIDAFYDWIYQRGLARLAARGITPQMLYAQLNEGDRQ